MVCFLKEKEMSNSNVKKIVIEINSREFEFTVEEAKDLLEALDSIVGEKKEYLPCPYPHSVYPPYYLCPPYKITWGTTSITGDTYIMTNRDALRCSTTVYEQKTI